MGQMRKDSGIGICFDTPGELSERYKALAVCFECTIIIVYMNSLWGKNALDTQAEAPPAGALSRFGGKDCSINPSVVVGAAA